MVPEPCSFFKNIFATKQTLENVYLKKSNICLLHIKNKVLGKKNLHQETVAHIKLVLCHKNTWQSELQPFFMEV